MTRDGVAPAWRRWTCAWTRAAHAREAQVPSKAAGPAGFHPLPLRWHIEPSLGTGTHRDRRLAGNLELRPKAAEDAVQVANFHRVLRDWIRDQDVQAPANRRCGADDRMPTSSGWIIRR